MNAAVTTAESPLTPTEPAPVDPCAAARKPPRVWKFWATLAWSILLYGVMTVSAAAGIVLAVRWYGIDVSAFAADKSAFFGDGIVVAATSMTLCSRG